MPVQQRIKNMFKIKHMLNKSIAENVRVAEMGPGFCP